ncbi:hypothetical protein C7M84_010202 [Penaeus vannamei]|uniref:Uncharacterized protein n=1 Tax=Penaeus vannamei TaxID=6689 RepID=A0A423T517_PENVA|nr:hypothetical protein C7M84_010202 [Penaeus vannamei]
MRPARARKVLKSNQRDLNLKEPDEDDYNVRSVRTTSAPTASGRAGQASGPWPPRRGPPHDDPAPTARPRPPRLRVINRRHDSEAAMSLRPTSVTTKPRGVRGTPCAGRAGTGGAFRRHGTPGKIRGGDGESGGRNARHCNNTNKQETITQGHLNEHWRSTSGQRRDTDKHKESSTGYQISTGQLEPQSGPVTAQASKDMQYTHAREQPPEGICVARRRRQRTVGLRCRHGRARGGGQGATGAKGGTSEAEPRHLHRAPGYGRDGLRTRPPFPLPSDDDRPSCVPCKRPRSMPEMLPLDPDETSPKQQGQATPGKSGHGARRAVGTSTQSGQGTPGSQDKHAIRQDKAKSATGQSDNRPRRAVGQGTPGIRNIGIRTRHAGKSGTSTPQSDKAPGQVRTRHPGSRDKARREVRTRQRRQSKGNAGQSGQRHARQSGQGTPWQSGNKGNARQSRQGTHGSQDKARRAVRTKAPPGSQTSTPGSRDKAMTVSDKHVGQSGQGHAGQVRTRPRRAVRTRHAGQSGTRHAGAVQDKARRASRTRARPGIRTRHAGQSWTSTQSAGQPHPGQGTPASQSGSRASRTRHAGQIGTRHPGSQRQRQRRGESGQGRRGKSGTSTRAVRTRHAGSQDAGQSGTRHAGSQVRHAGQFRTGSGQSLPGSRDKARRAVGTRHAGQSGQGARTFAHPW